ncbi:MAG TPA: fluoride efflux transporter CrcB [Vicinamibacterales bacterium]|nr:fluoride efflux transporter CrcB [Vicinamibacterales bacterium]
MQTWIAVAIGGALGSVARHAMNSFVSHRLTHAVPAATAIVNLIGCLVIGILTGLLVAGQIRMSMTARTFVFVGILGGFTTFSTFGLDTFTLMHEGRPLVAMANVLVQCVGGIAGVALGYALGNATRL